MGELNRGKKNKRNEEKTARHKKISSHISDVVARRQESISCVELTVGDYGRTTRPLRRGTDLSRGRATGESIRRRDADVARRNWNYGRRRVVCVFGDMGRLTDGMPVVGSEK